ncbi:MAG: argininosuccinate lyase [Archaeoglobaceae archaeon]|nr:argininosuccinate lyase [Archaeoglobaceae archaeon]MDW7989670.1 argininosuccinate lyase [Archaeoglobaceae archaeon]
MFRKERLGKFDPKALKFSSSIEHDSKIFYYDILVDVAHVLNLHKNGHIKREEALEIINALKEVRKKGYELNFEDVHEAIEAEVTKLTKEGKRMHTGRSRNDEVATCLRMFVRDHLIIIAEKIIELQSTILENAEKNDAIMPGFTHLQFAQPTRLSHHILTYFDMLDRDIERVIDAFRRANICPLGASAFASTSYSLDREFTAKILGFNSVLEHSEDAVSSRDFIIESIFVCSSIMLSISRIAEEIIIFSTLRFIELPNEFASTSSIMPQKKNPDIAELIRAKTGKIIGDLTSAMAIYKALPFSYNRDFQEMNKIIYDTMELTIESLEVMNGMMKGVKFNTALLKERSKEKFTTATEVADMLVKEFRIPFRDAHRIVSRIVSQNLPMTADAVEKTARDFGYEIKVDDEMLKDALDVEKAVERRRNLGGTAKEEVLRMIDKRKDKLRKNRRVIKRLREKIAIRLELMKKEVKKIGGILDVNG